MSRLILGRALPPMPKRGALSLDFSLDVGLHAVVGLPADGITAIAPLAGGLVQPRAGEVYVDRRVPYGDPSLRSRIGTLTAEPTLLPDVGTVQNLLDTVDSPRKSRALEILESFGTSELLSRRLRALSTDEKRVIELALALATPAPLAIFLTEPFAQTLPVSRSAIVQALQAMTEACVVVATSSVTDAVELGGFVHLLEAGRITRSLDALDATALPGREVELRVITDAPRQLAAFLASEGHLSSVIFDENLGASLVRLRGADLGEVALSVARAALATSAKIHSITPVAPSLDELRAASSGLALAAYHAAYRYGTAAPVEAPPPPAPQANFSEGAS